MFADATIVFDPDGTLVDTAPDLTNALNDVLTRRGLEPVAIEAIRGAVSHGARVMIEEALASAGARGDVDRMLAEFLVHYEANIARESPPIRARSPRWTASPRMGQRSRSAPTSASA